MAGTFSSKIIFTPQNQKTDKQGRLCRFLDVSMFPLLVTQSLISLTSLHRGGRFFGLQANVFGQKFLLNIRR